MEPGSFADASESRFMAYVERLATALQTEPAIALDQIRTAVGAGLPPGVVLMDAGYDPAPTCAPASVSWA